MRKSDLLLCFGISLCTRQIGTKVHEFAKGAEIVRVDIDPYNLQREIHEGRKGEKCFCVSAEDVACKLTEQQAQIGSYEEWLAVCRKIRKELEQVDDATPQRYPNRMIAYLSDRLFDTGAVAVDVGQHMVWSYQSFHNRQGQKTLFFPVDMAPWDMHFRQRSVLIMQQENRWHVSAETEHSR